MPQNTNSSNNNPSSATTTPLNNNPKPSSNTKSSTNNNSSNSKSSKNSSGQTTAVKRARGSSKKSSNTPTPASQAAIAAARANLAHVRGEREDPLWLAKQQQQISRDPNRINFDRIVQNALMNVNLSLDQNQDQIEASALQCLQEHARLYAWHLVADAQDFAMHRTGSLTPQITGPDLQLAVQNQNETTGKQRDVLIKFYDEVNVIPLPNIPKNCYTGVVLPRMEDTLLARSYDVVQGQSQSARAMNARSQTTNSKEKSSQAPKRRRNTKSKIEVKLKSHASSNANTIPSGTKDGVPVANTNASTGVGATPTTGSDPVSGVKRKADSVTT